MNDLKMASYYKMTYQKFFQVSDKHLSEHSVLEEMLNRVEP